MTHLYQISKGMAMHLKLPLYFVAESLCETEKAVYLFGHGTTETAKKGFCCVCGRTLTHPVSVELGIGPECGSHWWNWDLVGGYTKENILKLTQKIREDILIDTWFPKSKIISKESTNETVVIPSNHPMLNHKKSEQIKSAILTTTTRGSKVIKIVFPYNINDLDNVRNLSDRKYNTEEKYWTAPLTVESVEKLKQWNFRLDTQLEDFLKHAKLHVSQVSDSMNIPGLKGTLYPFQRQGIAFIEAKHGKALIGDEMGLGKTIQALGYIQLHPEMLSIIVVPASLKINWAREAEHWLSNPDIVILSGTHPYELNPVPRQIIINYDILSSWVEYLSSLNPDWLIFDEVHYLKNNSAKRTKAATILAKNSKAVSGLSGTFIINRPIEGYNAIRLIDKTIVGSYWDYAIRYCGAHKTRYGWDLSGATNMTELHEKLTNTIMLRRLKKDVLPQLPEKTRAFIPLEIDNDEEYQNAERDIINWLRETRGTDAAKRASHAAEMTKIEFLKQIAVRGKLRQAIEWISDFLETDNKLIIFVCHLATIDALMNAFPKITVKMDGSCSMIQRQDAVDAFQHNPAIKLFIGMIDKEGKPAGIGWNLAAASYIATLELQWSPKIHDQAEDRAHRIGQRSAVVSYYLLAMNTIEERIAHIQDRKRIMLDKVLDGQDSEQESLLTELIKSYYNDNTKL